MPTPLHIVRSAAYADSLPRYSDPQINYGTKRWIARHLARPGVVIEVDAPSKAAAKNQAGWKLGASAERVYVHEAHDPLISRMNRRA